MKNVVTELNQSDCSDDQEKSIQENNQLFYFTTHTALNRL